ncbi:MAG: metallopeptidase family protein [Phycisphaerae bacterium]
MDLWELTDDYRRTFDKMLEEAIYDLPPDLQKLTDEVFINAVDFPDRATLRKLGLRSPQQLRGLYTGVPNTRRTVYDHGRLPDRIEIYRLGIGIASRGRDGQIDPQRLAEQIRKTLLHEIGHHFGLDEDDLAGYGYA